MYPVPIKKFHISTSYILIIAAMSINLIATYIMQKIVTIQCMSLQHGVKDDKSNNESRCSYMTLRNHLYMHNMHIIHAYYYA